MGALSGRQQQRPRPRRSLKKGRWLPASPLFGTPGKQQGGIAPAAVAGGAAAGGASALKTPCGSSSIRAFGGLTPGRKWAHISSGARRIPVAAAAPAGPEHAAAGDDGRATRALTPAAAGGRPGSSAGALLTWATSSSAGVVLRTVFSSVDEGGKQDLQRCGLGQAAAVTPDALDLASVGDVSAAATGSRAAAVWAAAAAAAAQDSQAAGVQAGDADDDGLDCWGRHGGAAWGRQLGNGTGQAGSCCWWWRQRRIGCCCGLWF